MRIVPAWKPCARVPLPPAFCALFQPPCGPKVFPVPRHSDAVQPLPGFYSVPQFLTVSPPHQQQQMVPQDHQRPDVVLGCAASPNGEALSPPATMTTTMGHVEHLLLMDMEIESMERRHSYLLQSLSSLQAKHVAAKKHPLAGSIHEMTCIVRDMGRKVTALRKRHSVLKSRVFYQ